jgi:uncharacterized membrane protein YgdD (TMEM256/DUF423 family)
MEDHSLYLTLQKWFSILGGLLAMLAVAAGAFGAHLLRQTLNPQSLNAFEVGVRYQMYHALALIAIAWALGSFPHSLVATSGWLLFAGTLIFSGSLYILALSGARFWGAITPIGGVILLAGWLLFIIGIALANRIPA